MSEWSKERIEQCLVPVALRAKPRVQARDYKSSGRFPIVDQGQEFVGGWIDDAAGLITAELPVVVFGDHTRTLKYVDFPFVRGADGTQILKPRADIDPLFFYFACRAVDLPARGYNRHFKALKGSEIAVPSRADQERIARSLKLIEDLQFLQLEQQSTLRNTKRAVMHALFTRGLRGEAQKDSEIGPIPESWDLVAIESVREWLQYGTSTPCSYEETPFPVLRIPNITAGVIDANDMKFARLSVSEAERYRLNNGDLIFIRTNGVIERLGACAVYDGEPDGALFASYLIRARLKVDRVNPYFAAQFFGSDLGTSIIAGRATPAADGKFNLNTSIIDSLPLPLPPTLDEQAEIVTALDTIDRKIDLHRRKRAVLDELFKTLLHELMTGEIRVADLDLQALERNASAAA